jgi:site-specific recombinase XerD
MVAVAWPCRPRSPPPANTAARRFLEFFAATIRNKNTRMAYYRAVTDFFAWLDAAGIGTLVDIEPLHVATYIEALQERMAKPTVKQHLAAIRMLFDWLVTGGILATNPATSVRGPKHVIKRGKTPVLTTDQARMLIESIDTSTLVGLRDRALIGVMTYAFARIGAVVSMRVEDYFANGKRWWVRLHEKGGKRHEMPAHHKLEAFLDEYIRTAGIAGNDKSPLFRSAVRRTGTLAATAMHRVDAWRMVQRRATDLGMKVRSGATPSGQPGSRLTLKPAGAPKATWTPLCRISTRPSGSSQTMPPPSTTEATGAAPKAIWTALCRISTRPSGSSRTMP